MDKSTRAKIIFERVIAHDDQFGHDVPPRSPESRSQTRQISADPRWHAVWSKEYEKGSGGEMWDLFELFVYNDRRMTAIAYGDRVVPRFYMPGPWEPILLCFDPRDNTPLKPGWPN